MTFKNLWAERARRGGGGERRETLEHTTLNKMSSSNPSAYSSGNSTEEAAEGVWEPGGIQQENKLSESAERGSQELTETEAVSPRHTRVYTRSSVHIL